MATRSQPLRTRYRSSLVAASPGRGERVKRREMDSGLGDPVDPRGSGQQLILAKPEAIIVVRDAAACAIGETTSTVQTVIFGINSMSDAFAASLSPSQEGTCPTW